MALTITEANAVNVLVRAVYGEQLEQRLGGGAATPSAGAVYEAAHFLLTRAHNSLAAGIVPRDLPVPEVEQ